MAKATTKSRRAGNSPKKAKTSKRDTVGNNGRSTDGRFTKRNQYGFQPGQSGNPAGRPRDTVTPHLRELVRTPGKDGVTYGELVAQTLLARAVDGDVQAIREVFDRLEGKPRQAIDVSVEEKRRAIFETGLDMLQQAGVSHEEAARLLTTIYPEASGWVN